MIPGLSGKQYTDIKAAIIDTIARDLDMFRDNATRVGVVLHQITFHDSRYALELRDFSESDLNSVCASYKSDGYCIQQLFYISVNGIQAFLLAMERNEATDPLCLVGDSFGIKVHGHCIVVTQAAGLQIMKKKLLPKVCANCGLANATFKCGGCLCKYYCHQLCQRSHWKEHKKSHVMIECTNAK